MNDLYCGIIQVTPQNKKSFTRDIGNVDYVFYTTEQRTQFDVNNYNTLEADPNSEASWVQPAIEKNELIKLLGKSE